jgi:acetoacetyl-CoA reductase/3-oxoacyl-[acyl-carrier protein] reductase
MSQRKRIAIVTGGSRGLGAAIATHLAEDGATVIVNYVRNAASANTTVRNIIERGGHAEAVQADVSEPAGIERLFEHIRKAHGRLDVLVNNAGINRDGAFLEMKLADWDAVHATNLRGPFLCCQQAARLMLASPPDDGGKCIVNIGASTGVRGRANGANYCTAKAGLMVLTRCLALELAPHVRVNTVVPGLVATDETRERFHLDDAAAAERHTQQIPLRRLGTPGDIAEAVAFLCSTQARYITGQTLYVNGGHYMAV